MLHKEYVKKQLKNPQFKEAYDIEKEIARLSIEIQLLRMEKGITQDDLDPYDKI